MDDIYKITQNALRQTMQDLASTLPSKSVAGGLFMNHEPYMPPSISDHLRWTFGADRLISVIAEDIESWKKNVPENKHLVVYLRTPNGELMDVSVVKPTGWQGFVAEGHVNGLPCMVAGHVSTLMLFCSYEETRGRSSVGFKVITEVPSTTQTESSPIAPDSK